MPLVYRIEHPKSGMGPYRGLELILDNYEHAVSMMENWDKGDNNPSPRDDGCILPKRARVRDYRFGFADLSQAQQWFKWALPDLKHYGFKLRQYEVPTMIKCKHQIAFKKSLAELCKTLPLSKLQVK